MIKKILYFLLFFKNLTREIDDLDKVYIKISHPKFIINAGDIDFKNNSGWIHWSQLKKINSIIPTKDKILFENPTNFSKPLAKIKSGRVLIVQKCNGIWCKINTDDFEGWIKTDNIWGVLD